MHAAGVRGVGGVVMRREGRQVAEGGSDNSAFFTATDKMCLFISLLVFLKSSLETRFQT